MTGSKARMRVWARRRRAAVDFAAASRLISDALAGCGLLRGTVLTYLALPNEVDLSALPSALPSVTWTVTRTPPSGQLTVHALDSPMEKHRLGFAQPEAGTRQVPPEAIDVALVPGLAFDRHGVRLGRGAGYFDRLLSFVRADCVRIGVTPRALICNRLPAEPHDVPMTHLASEAGVVAVGDETVV